jgi:plastocyanin
MRTTIRILVLSTVGMLSLLMLGAAPARAGGGCHQGITTGEADEDEAATVEMVDACFTPTTLQVAPGTEVTFVNRDAGITHNVGGHLWGHFDGMRLGDAFTATFDVAGTYPFACSYHPGMTGAVIVGDGSGTGDGGAISVQPFEPPDPVIVTKTGGGWAVAGAIGLFAGVAGGIGLARVRRG